MHTIWHWIGYLSFLFLLAALLPVTKDGFVQFIKSGNEKVAEERLKVTVIWLLVGGAMFAFYMVLKLLKNGVL